MPLTHPQIIAAQAGLPQTVLLWRALQSLRSVVSFMNTGAHPDDETSSLLAALRFRDGLSISYACANRGEGGQNDIGTEASQDLGVVRTAEMERAADVLDMSLYWLSQHPSDTIYDFGFPKVVWKRLDIGTMIMHSGAWWKYCARRDLTLFARRFSIFPVNMVITEP